MTLNQIAKQAMDYLDSVGVAADYEIENGIVTIETDDYFFWSNKHSLDDLMTQLKEVYPQKSPA